MNLKYTIFGSEGSKLLNKKLLWRLRIKYIVIFSLCVFSLIFSIYLMAVIAPQHKYADGGFYDLGTVVMTPE